MATDSTYARYGSAGHLLAEWARRDKQSAWQWLNKPIRIPYQSDPTKHEEFIVDGEMADAVDAYVDYVSDFGADAEFYELRVNFTAWVPHGFGTSDDIRLRLHDKRAKITDLKMGQGKPVYATNNPQNRLYALGTFQELNWLYDFDADWTWELGIFQPRLGIVDTETITTAELLEWANTVAAPGAKRALTPGAPFKAGDWCTFCAIKKTCRTRTEFYANAVLDKFDDVDERGEPTQSLAVKSINEMTREEMFQIHLLAPGINKLLDDIAEFGHSELANNRPFGDRKLVAGKGYYYYTDPKRAESRLIGLLGDDAWQPTDILSPAQARKKLGKLHDFMVEEVARGDGKPTMVGPEDKRPPYAQLAVEQFENLDVAEFLK